MNTGFIVMLCNERVKAVYDAMLAEDLNRFYIPEQNWLNDQLGGLPVRWGLLPPAFYA